ncbi:MAG: DUF935 family protein [Patescibacteria group bacterium]|nr:DUF935 family protein [Patescibacteria group bacterium]
MAKIETLAKLGGIPDMAPPAEGIYGVGPAAPPVDGEMGAAGTPIFGGFLRELGEYNPNFSGGPFASFLLYEQMRRSDGRVASVLSACKLPISSAEWAINPPEDASDEEKAAADFIEDQIFHKNSLKAAIQNALLMLDFGCAVHEDVWRMDGGKVCLERMAPRLPLTFYRWLTNPGTDELAGLDQLGYRAGSYVHATMPIGKIALFTYRQEGANYAGRSLQREMYQHWYSKQALYAIAAIAAERNGMGVPVVTMGPKAKLEDKKAALAWVSALVTHEKTGLVLPPEWKFDLIGVKGTVRDPEPLIQHHDAMIAAVALCSFIVMGQSGGRSSGNRSLGETMSDFFFQGLQATADYIGQVFSETTIARLVKFNFGEGVRPPRLVPQDLIASKIETIGTVLAQLSGKNALITPDTDLEAWLREKLGAPERMPDLSGDDPEDQAAQVPPGQPVQQPVGQPVQPKQNTQPTEQQQPGAPAKQGKAGAPARGGKKVKASEAAWRAPKTAHQAMAESHLALFDIVSSLDKGRNDVATALRGARSRMQAEVVNKLVNTPVANMHRVSIAPDEKLRTEVHKVLAGVHDFGREQVGRERARQLSGRPPGDAATVRMSARRDPLGVYADGVVSEFTNSLTARAANVALDHLRRPGDATKGEVIRNIESDLDEQSDKWIDPVASKGTNEAFADGRQAGYEDYKDEIGSVIYSALLDINTCGDCANADGQEGATPGDIPDVPNPDCDGGDKCRCVHVYVFSDEGKEAA